MPASGAVTRNTLRQQIADALRDEVLAGRLLPGQEFTVKQIAEQYGVSATPVREALVDLSAQDLLDSDQHRGFRVHQFSVADFRGMVEARALIVDAVFRTMDDDGTATRGTAGGGAPTSGTADSGAPTSEAGGRPLAVVAQGAALVSVRRRAEAAARAARAGDLTILIGYDLRFWRELCALVANRYVAEFLDRLRVQEWVFSVPFLRAEAAEAEAAREREARSPEWLWNGYESLTDALTLGDVAAVRTVVADYDAHSLRWADRLERLRK
ncbi:GntR family transcriptional regulator [Streptomyces sp. NPDC093085]|uniref:GntR family transcriptional regulator n=1 Tax=Streptomyces sp. NPDC093085 TaxID=3155068 RepID=UPI003423DAC8